MLVNFENGTLSVLAKDKKDRLDKMEDVKEALTEKHGIKLNVEGMTCTNCAESVTKVLEREGVNDILVSYTTDEVLFTTTEPDKIEKVKEGISSLGYDVSDANEDVVEGKKKGFKFTLERKFYISALLTIPLLVSMFLPQGFLHEPYVQLALCLPVYLIGLHQFGKSSLGALRMGTTNMDVLILIGSTAAFIYSLVGTFAQLGPDFLFYETAATIITLVLLGNILEHRSVKNTTTALRELSKIQPNTAKLVVYKEGEAESTQEVATKDLLLGDVVLVNSGDAIPADGKVIWGTGSANEAMITGESMPTEKEEGSEVIGGTILENGSIKVRVKAAGKKAYLAKVIDLVTRAQQDKPEIQLLADKISAIFVPLILGITAVVFIVSYFVVGIPLSNAVLNSIAVLAIACPCAMGLATPTAVMVGIGRVTKQGILIKGGKTIEELNTIKQIVFDKTGTLTTGKFIIDNIELVGPDITSLEVKKLLMALEMHSSHPIATSMVKAIGKIRPAELTKIKEKRGLGMEGYDVEGRHYELGSFQLARNFTLDHKHDLFLFRDGEMVAKIDITDEIKPDAKETIDHLKEKGIMPIMLSGDRYHKCAAVCHELGIEKFYAEKRPEEKLDIIRKLDREMPTAMVGDGINDAPALAKATIGISLSEASQVAIDSSQVILLDGKLSNLIQAFGIAKSTLTTIKQNLFWAFSYNIVAVPIAAFGLLNPMFAALFMAFSDIVVVGNSLRLKRKKIV